MIGVKNGKGTVAVYGVPNAVYRAGTQWNQNYVPNNTVVCSQAQLVLTANQHQAKVQCSLLHNNDNMRCVTATKKHNKRQKMGLLSWVYAPQDMKKACEPQADWQAPGSGVELGAG